MIFAICHCHLFDVCHLDFVCHLSFVICLIFAICRLDPDCHLPFAICNSQTLPIRLLRFAYSLMHPPLLRVERLTKRYGRTTVLDCDLEVRSGEIHALVGANGAGKSTLSKIVAGMIMPSSGEVLIAGSRWTPGNKQAAEAQGVQIVQQELNLIPTWTVAENLFLGRLPARAGFIPRRRLHERARRALDRLNLYDIDTSQQAVQLGVGRQQMVEIASALDRECRLLILDEPTAALSAGETQRLFQWLRKLRSDGVGMVYISHRLEEIKALADRVSILRDGQRIGTYASRDTSADELVALMSGVGATAAVESIGAERLSASAAALQVEGLSCGVVHNVSFAVQRGERLGIAGLVGSGRTELLRAIFGADAARSGAVRVGDSPPRRFRHPSQAVRAGVAMVTEDRKQNGLLLSQPLRINATLACLPKRFARLGWIRCRAESTGAATIAGSLDTQCTDVEQMVETLSGGNQQKVVLAKWLLQDANVFLFDEPTRGIDVAARRRIHQLFRSLADSAKALVIVSSDIEELLETCDRIVVLSAGRLVASFQSGQCTVDQLMQAAFSQYVKMPALPTRIRPHETPNRIARLGAIRRFAGRARDSLSRLRRP